jgi:aconitate hydratase
MTEKPTRSRPIKGARCLASSPTRVTTDHISPAGDIAEPAPPVSTSSPRRPKHDFNSYGSRRGNDRVMTRGTFANVRVKNNLAVDPATGKIKEGGWTRTFQGRRRQGRRTSTTPR